LNLRGELYRLIASSLAVGWPAHLQEIETRGSGDIEQRKLEELLKHAVANVPYYRNLEIPTCRLESFPLLSRETLRTQFDALKSDDLQSRRWIKCSTGGSTGEPVWVVRDREALDWDYATDMYYMSAFYNLPHHEYLRSRRVAIWHRRRRPAGTGLLKQVGVHLLGQVIYIEPYVILTEKKLTEYVRRINRHKPIVILAFAGTVFELAKHAQRLGMRVHSPRFILTSVETLYPAMRATIQDVFGCRVYNRYGAAEVGRVAAECAEGKVHVFSFNNHVEVLDSEGHATRPGDRGRVVVTSLHNTAMPLIRYDIGDLVRVSSEPCRCGSLLPAWDEVSGRVIHHFVRSDGGLVFGGNFIAMFYEYNWILQLHVLQVDINRVKISYRRTPGTQVPKQDVAALSQTVRDVMGDCCVVEWEEVDVIPHSAIGKHLHARSLVWEETVGIS
jgi:phenylacetate-coenzyme A ligase PaaK-like adenylate-forming protein